MLKCTKFDFQMPPGGAYSTLPDSLAGFNTGHNSKGREGTGRERGNAKGGKGMEGEREIVQF